MEENGDEIYYGYLGIRDSIMVRLGIGETDWSVTPEQKDYLIRILVWLNKKLVRVGLDADLRTKIDVVIDSYTYCAEKIVNEDILVIMNEILGIDESWNSEVFAFTLGDVLSSLTTRLKITYADLLREPKPQGCPCPCGYGETREDWESYVSGVEDESESSYSSSTGTGRVITESCCCSYRK